MRKKPNAETNPGTQHEDRSKNKTQRQVFEQNTEENRNRSSRSSTSALPRIEEERVKLRRKWKKQSHKNAWQKQNVEIDRDPDPGTKHAEDK